MNDQQMTAWAEKNLPKPKTLKEAIRQRNAWCGSAMQFSRNEDFYHGIVTQIGEMLGEEAEIADDGSKPGGVLALRVPEIVAARLGLPAPVLSSGEASR